MVSGTTGLDTGTPRMLACNCMHRLLAVMPPSTLRVVRLTPESAAMASTTSRQLVAHGLKGGARHVGVGVEPGQADDGAAGVARQ